MSTEETLQDVAENEIESNWDQIVDKYVAILSDQPLEHGYPDI